MLPKQPVARKLPVLDSHLILFEDEDILVLNKPAGLIVNAATSHHQISLQEQLADYLHLSPWSKAQPVPDEHASPETVFAFRQGMVHRLDKDTSGILLWAKNPAALTNLLHQFQARLIAKSYLCLVHGLITADSGRIFRPLARQPSMRQRMAVVAGGRTALTNFTVQKRFPHFNFERLLALLPPDSRFTRTHLEKLYQGFTLLQALPKTGRTHQIRAHFTHLGHPLVGDLLYLPRRKANLDPLWCPRQFLHAHSLSFTHPRTHQPLTFKAPLPPDLQQALTFLNN
ncbi:RluA family pseudouridine synthase [bacterium]|nr:RluA family pseudouridine synthase [bacterium]